jgi:hypothetical protein
VRKTVAPITFVTRKGDARCLAARKIVEHTARRYKLQIEDVDVDGEDPSVREKLETDLPVILIDGKRRFSGYLQAPLFEQAIRTRKV